ncbi:unnamed protein product [Candida verbasci]|uniref:Large ribosomal subunit protein bL32m n=1 Tax=Candida verbasci TaxID=1227364 RepID=A0A9W4X8B3_9ASCO|nr:unnamed protein product [Candida verbasci]
MSLVYRFGLISQTIQEAVWGIPRIPQISITLPKKLQELKEKLFQEDISIDNGSILRAVPKKKLSHRRHRVKQYAAGRKQIQQLENLVRCPACGSVKRSHFMCMNCFDEIKTFLKGLKRANGLIKDTVIRPMENFANPRDETIIYPGKFTKPEERQLKAKEYIPKREEPIMFQKGKMLHNKKRDRLEKAGIYK